MLYSSKAVAVAGLEADRPGVGMAWKITIFLELLEMIVYFCPGESTTCSYGHLLVITAWLKMGLYIL